MNPLNCVTCKSMDLQNKSDFASSRLFEQLYKLVDQFYLIDDRSKLLTSVLYPQLPGVFVTYHFHDQLIGFTRLSRRVIELEGQIYAVYFGGTYHDPSINLTAQAARFGLMSAVRYKLFQPNHQLVYLANANNPQRFDYIQQLSDKVETHAKGHCPQLIKQLMRQVCQLNGWQFDQDNPQLVHNILPLKPAWSDNVATDASAFMALNPDYMAGDSLFMYLPLDTETLGACLHRSVSEVS